MEVQQQFIEFLNTNKNINKIIEDAVNRNDEMVPIDLNDIKNFNIDLYISIQNNFVQKEKYLQESFKNYVNSKFNRTLELSFSNPSVSLKIRELRADILGNLVSFTGTSTRATQVRPELSVGCFVCRDCNSKIPNVLQEFKYTQPLFCSNHLCPNRTKFDLDLSESQFSNWQRIHVQESPDEIPSGSLPRTIDVIVRNSLVEKIKPGSRLKFTGYCVSVPDVLQLGLPSMKSIPISEGTAPEKQKRNVNSKELNYKIVFYCIHADIEAESDICNEDMSVIRRMQMTPNLYEKLSESLFPTIHGHSNIKSSILLMLVGGVSKSKDINLRGDINILLVGDPGTAKSQFLKQTSSFFPRSVYTSGKSSSAAGLTAAVVKDAETGEFTIDAGALMLSDQGVCCIDEFDKMNYKDQVSIHEAMEQQTITITKAGINATINTRTSVLAAANPIKGRYDKRKSLRQNVNLSPPIMSRFDLYFVLIDEVDAENDRRVASKILDNHLLYNNYCRASADDSLSMLRNNTENNFNRNNNENNFNRNNNDSLNKNNNFNNNNVDSLSALKSSMERPFSVQEVLTYIKHIKDLKPILSKESHRELIGKYVSLRQDSLINTNNYRMTVRHLESLIRLSEALAKIHNDTVVGIPYIQEAYRLLKSSVVEIRGDDIELVCKQTEDTISLKNKDYLKISNSLVYLVKSGSFTRDELALKYLELIEDFIESTQMLHSEKAKCLSVLDFLIEHEGVMYEVDGLVHIHPNYDN